MFLGVAEGKQCSLFRTLKVIVGDVITHMVQKPVRRLAEEPVQMRDKFIPASVQPFEYAVKHIYRHFRDSRVVRGRHVAGPDAGR